MTYCNSVLELKRNAFMTGGVCERYKKEWDRAETYKDLADMAMTVQGADFICASVANKWGMKNEDMMIGLYDFANGNYVHRVNGYNVEMYLEYEGKIVVKSTLYIVLNSDDVEIHIPRYRAANIYIAGCRNVRIDCEGTAYIVNYGDCNINVVRGNSDTVIIAHPTEIKDSWYCKNPDDEKA